METFEGKVVGTRGKRWIFPGEELTDDEKGHEQDRVSLETKGTAVRGGGGVG